MSPRKYHEGQRQVQTEANCIKVADSLADWVGPVANYAMVADLIVLATLEQSQAFNFTVLSGPAPLITATTEGDDIILSFPEQVLEKIPAGKLCGGIVINLAQARRSRIGGAFTATAELRCQTAFTNCRKYMAPSQSLGNSLNIGPATTETIALDDPLIGEILSRAETSFLATTAPDGKPDVSHRGGQPGFLHYEPQTGEISWTEYLGDGMFVSSGNIRATGRFALLVLDIHSRDGLVFHGEGDYTNIRASRHERVDALVQDKEAFSVQGRMNGRITSVSRLINICHPRQPVERITRVTACSTTDEQAPN